MFNESFRVMVCEPLAINDEKFNDVLTKVKNEIFSHCVRMDSYTSYVSLLTGVHYNKIIESKGGQQNTVYHHNTDWENDPTKSSRVYINLTLLTEAIQQGFTDMKSIVEYINSRK